MLRNSCLAFSNPQMQIGSAQRLFTNARNRARWNQFWSLVTGKPAKLLDLKAIRENNKVCVRCDDGLRMVSIDQICGSESRVHDFDAGFNPLHENTKDRWINIAAAMQRGCQLLPVILIQIGESYFVRDGHHRISVVRAQGQKIIQAKVEIWAMQA